MLRPTSGVVALFTDGSAWYKDHSGGWAFVAFDLHDNELVGSGGSTDATSNRMEMTAVIEGLHAVHDDCGPSKVLVYSDSEVLIFGAIGIYKRRANRDLWERLDLAVDLHKMVHFEHVKGHHESHYNDLVDKLAGKARKHAQNTAEDHS